MGSYIPATPSQREEMLNVVGVKDIADLYQSIPKELLVGDNLNLPEGMSELEVRAAVSTIAEKNRTFRTILRGAGSYNHYIPAVVQSVTTREEFVTAYTPYQAEISQGILQSIFEFQTMICMLTGMDVANASVYDGATAVAEALTMCKERKRNKVYISACTHPHVIETVKTYCFGSDTEIAIVPEKDGKTDIDILKAMLGDDAACFCLQQPNFYGLMEDAAEIGEIVHASGAKYIMSVNPIASALMKTAAECGADIAVGDGQPLGLNMAFGGPYLGFMACTHSMLRKLPGRIVGQTVDVDGQRAFALTLTAREQHIRREKASSNICSNQAHCALIAGAYMSAMGGIGMKQAAKLSMSKAHYLAGQLEKHTDLKLKYIGEFFNEFVTVCDDENKKQNILSALQNHGILGGLPVNGGILWCVTEVVTKAEMDKTVETIKGVL